MIKTSEVSHLGCASDLLSRSITLDNAPESGDTAKALFELLRNTRESPKKLSDAVQAIPGIRRQTSAFVRALLSSLQGDGQSALCSLSEGEEFYINNWFFLYIKSTLLFDLGRVDEAKKYVTAALGVSAVEPDLWHMLGICHSAKFAIQAAIAAHQRCLELDGQRPHTLSNLSVALEDAGRLDEALAVSEAAIGYSSQVSDVHHNHAGLLTRAGRISEAASMYEQIIQNDFDPDLTFLLDAPIDVIKSRRKLNPNDRFESEDRQFFERVRQGYLQLASVFGDRVIIIDATQSIEQVQAEIQSYLLDFIEKTS